MAQAERRNSCFVRKKPNHSIRVRKHAGEQLGMQRPVPLGPFVSMDALVKKSHAFCDVTSSRLVNSFRRFEL